MGLLGVSRDWISLELQDYTFSIIMRNVNCLTCINKSSDVCLFGVADFNAIDLNFDNLIDFLRIFQNVCNLRVKIYVIIVLLFGFGK